MLQRLQVCTAEFPLNVHVVNVAEPPFMPITPPCNVRSYNQEPTIAYASCSERQQPETLRYCIPEDN